MIEYSIRFKVDEDGDLITSFETDNGKFSSTIVRGVDALILQSLWEKYFDPDYYCHWDENEDEDEDYDDYDDDNYYDDDDTEVDNFSWYHSGVMKDEEEVEF